ncbi:hypothetical protein FACS1894191_7330 [Clostridia bacterium]|nr:hypothetical protein FACS1894191_7330 [Clostridia bacterium]
MSMPTIQIDPINREDALSNLLASIALEEAALAHILNAEGEKIQYALEKIPGVTLDQLLAVNDSVRTVMNGAGEVENTLKDKLAAVTKALA